MRATERQRRQAASSQSACVDGERNEQLEIRNLTVEYHRQGLPSVQAVVDVDLDVHPGQVVGLVGESGCGKSTLAKAAIGLVPPASGTVCFDGIDVEPLGSGARPPRLRQIQMVFQDPYASLNPRRRIGKQIADGLRGRTGDGARAPAQGRLAARAGRPQRLDRRPLPVRVLRRPAPAHRHRQGAGGGSGDHHRRRGGVGARRLDAGAGRQPAASASPAERDAGLLFISHDLGIVRHISDTVAVMYLGRIVERGRTESVWEHLAHPYTRALIAAVPRHDGSRHPAGGARR